MRYKFDLTVDVDEGMGFNTSDIVRNHIEQAIRDAGDSGISFSLELYRTVERKDGGVYLNGKYTSDEAIQDCKDWCPTDAEIIASVFVE